MISDHEEVVEESDGEEPVKKCHIGFMDALIEVPNGDAAAASELTMTERGLTSLATLEAFKSLKKLELRGNHLVDNAFLEMNHSLCWVGLAKNRLRKVNHLQNLVDLAVLDVSDNKISQLDGLQSLRGLKTLIAARNRISRLGGALSPKKNKLLETLVLSHNRIAECSLSGFENLRKLSLAHNQLHSFPELKQLPALAELRLNGNRLTLVSRAVSSLPKLSTLDIGNNLIKEVKDLEPLRGLLWMKNLNLLGNPVAGEVGADLTKDVKALLATLPRLEILNNRRQVGEAQKKKKKKTAETQEKEKKKVLEVPAVPVAVHGRSFQGKSIQFENSDDDDEVEDEPTPVAARSSSDPSIAAARGRGRGGGRGRGALCEAEDSEEELRPMRGGRGRGVREKRKFSKLHDSRAVEFEAAWEAAWEEASWPTEKWADEAEEPIKKKLSPEGKQFKKKSPIEGKKLKNQPPGEGKKLKKKPPSDGTKLKKAGRKLKKAKTPAAGSPSLLAVMPKKGKLKKKTQKRAAP